MRMGFNTQLLAIGIAALSAAWVLNGSVALALADDPAASGRAESPPSTPEAGDVQERAVIGDVRNQSGFMQQPPQPGGAPPPNLCRQVTQMLPQCKCSNQADCSRSPRSVLSPALLAVKVVNASR